jgi:hypothetical protein
MIRRIIRVDSNPDAPADLENKMGSESLKMDFDPICALCLI